MKVNF